MSKILIQNILGDLGYSYDKIFLYKVKDSDDRDCCVYIANKPMRFECGRYFCGVVLDGSSFYNGEWEEYDNITTVLSKQDYELLVQFNKDIRSLKSCIPIGNENYNRGVELCKAIQPVYDKLNSEENKIVFAKVIEEEKEYLMEKHNLDEEEIKEIFDNYGLEYRDRGIVNDIFDDVNELAYEQACYLGYVDDYMDKYFDYEKFGEELLDSGYYHQLSDGRVVWLSY